MPVDDFRTVADELLHVAVAAEDFFVAEGYEVFVEINEIGFPFTPTFVCKMGHTTLIVELSSALDERRADRWIRFSKSQMNDTRFGVLLLSEGALSQRTMDFVIGKRIGLFSYSDGAILQVREPVDLAMQVELPDIRDLAKPVRPILAQPFRKFRDGDWRDGLGEAYQNAEQLGRDYLKTGLDSGRIVINVVRNKKPHTITSAEVDQMTLGQLKDMFLAIQNQNHKDVRIGQALAMINVTRIDLAHRRQNAAAEARLRAQAGTNMYAVITCLEELTS